MFPDNGAVYEMIFKTWESQAGHR